MRARIKQTEDEFVENFNRNDGIKKDEQYLRDNYEKIIDREEDSILDYISESGDHMTANIVNDNSRELRVTNDDGVELGHCRVDIAVSLR